MENKRLHRINNERFTVRLCTISRAYQLKTVGKFYDFIIGVDEVKHGTPNRIKKLKKELEDYLRG